MTSNLLDPVILHTDLPDLQLLTSGKVRDVYQLDNDRLLFVATDRISAFDYVLATGIPNKGRVLTQISLFWFDFLSDIVPNHLITADVERYPRALRKYDDQLRGRSMIVQRAQMFPVECVVRGYISGSAWKEYKASGKVCGIDLPAGPTRVGGFSGADLHPGDKGNQRTRRKYSILTHVRDRGRRDRQPFARPDFANLQESCRVCPATRYHHRRHEI